MKGFTQFWSILALKEFEKTAHCSEILCYVKYTHNFYDVFFIYKLSSLAMKLLHTFIT